MWARITRCIIFLLFVSTSARAFYWQPSFNHSLYLGLSPNMLYSAQWWGLEYNLSGDAMYMRTSSSIGVSYHLNKFSRLLSVRYETPIILRRNYKRVWNRLLFPIVALSIDQLWTENKETLGIGTRFGLLFRSSPRSDRFSINARLTYSITAPFRHAVLHEQNPQKLLIQFGASIPTSTQWGRYGWLKKKEPKVKF